MEFFVPCGEGDQSLKWLSMVAAQQYDIRRPKGRARSREPANSSRGFFLPSGMQSGKGESLRDPNSKVNEVFADGAEVVVELQDAVEVDAVGAPALSEWQQKSFCVGEASKLRLASEAKRKEEERKKQQRDKRMEMNVTATVGKMETIGISITNVNYDWSTIVEVIGDSSQKDQDELEEYFPTAYPILQEIFDFYTGGGETMTLAEFSHALHISKIYNANRDLDLIKSNIAKCKKLIGTAGEGKHDDLGDELLTKEEFLATMILIGREKSRGAKRSTESIQDLVDGYIAVSWIDARAEDSVKRMMDSSRVTNILREARPFLRELYDNYVQNEAGVMTADIFSKIMKDAGILTRNPGERPGDAEERTSTLAENCFFGAQGFPPRQLELPELVFSEFLEATCRLCAETLGGKENFDKFQLGVDALMDLKRASHK